MRTFISGLGLIFFLFFSQANASDQLPGNKYFLVIPPSNSLNRAVEPTTTINLLKWTQFNAIPPKPPEKYVRQHHFGIWIDFPHDNTCLTTRGIVLARDSKVPVKVYPNEPCYVATGSWFDPYTNLNYPKATQVQIDHVVPLKNAYISGAYEWPWKARCAYFNFLGNRFHLMPVESQTNTQKSDKSIENWTPPNKAYQCQYASNWLKIKTIWGLRMSEDEVVAIKRIVTNFRCDPKLYQMEMSELASQRNAIQQFANECPDSPPTSNSSADELSL